MGAGNRTGSPVGAADAVTAGQSLQPLLLVFKKQELRPRTVDPLANVTKQECNATSGSPDVFQDSFCLPHGPGIYASITACAINARENGLAPCGLGFTTATATIVITNCRDSVPRLAGAGRGEAQVRSHIQACHPPYPGRCWSSDELFPWRPEQDAGSSVGL